MIRKKLALLVAFTLSFTALCACTDIEQSDEGADSHAESISEEDDSSGASDEFLKETTYIKIGDESYEVYEKNFLFNFQELPYEDWIAYESPFDEYIPLLLDDGSGTYDKTETVGFALRYAYEQGIEYISVPMEYDMSVIDSGWEFAGLSYPDVPLSIMSSQITPKEDGYYEIHIGDSTLKAAGRFQETLDAAREIVDSIPPEYDTDALKAYYLYDWVCQNVAYDVYHIENTGYVNNTPQSAYGALVEKRAVCDGIASAVQLLFNMAGIECGKVEGIDISDDEHIGHVWNYAKIDGEIWDFDATWDLTRYCLDESDEITTYDNYGFYSWFGIERAAKTQDMCLTEVCAVVTPLTSDIYTENSPCQLVYDAAVCSRGTLSCDYYVEGEQCSKTDFFGKEIKNLVDRYTAVNIKFNSRQALTDFVSELSAADPIYSDISNKDLIYLADQECIMVILFKQ